MSILAPRSEIPTSRFCPFCGSQAEQRKPSLLSWCPSCGMTWAINYTSKHNPATESRRTREVKK